MEFLLDLLHMTIAMSTPFLFGVIGGLYTNRAGVMNFTLEGIMAFGAFGSIFFTLVTQQVWLGILLALILCLLVQYLFAILVFEFGGSPLFVGFSINLVSASVIPFFMIAVFNKKSSLGAGQFIDPALMIKDLPILRSIPVLSTIFNNHTFLTYASFFVVVVLTIILYKTKFGLHLRVTGENEDAAKSLGINVKRIRYMALTICAICCALGGINMAVENLGMYTNGMIAGRGYICLSAIMCGRNKPVRSTLFALLFGLAKAVQIRITAYVDSTTASLIGMLPYLAMLIVLVVTEYPVARKNPERIFR
jgi:simple sugar transport system permease protein